MPKKPTKQARKLAARLNAAESLYREQIHKINAPVIEILEQISRNDPSNKSVAGLRDFLKGRRLTEVAAEDLNILGEIWESLRSSRPDIDLMSWRVFLVEADRLSSEAMNTYHEQVKRARDDVADQDRSDPHV